MLVKKTGIENREPRTENGRKQEKEEEKKIYRPL
jgi:hypothetical protein